MPDFGAGSLSSFGKSAASDYLDDGTLLVDTISKIARSEDLNPNQIQRVCEFANHEVLSRLMDGSDKTAEFPLADPRKITGSLNVEEPEKIAAVAEYMPPPKELINFTPYTYKEPVVEKVAEKQSRPPDLLELREMRTVLLKHALKHEIKLDRLYDSIHEKVAGLTNKGTSFGQIKYAMHMFYPKESFRVVQLFLKLASEKDVISNKLDNDDKPNFKYVNGKTQLVREIGDFAEAANGLDNISAGVDEADKRLRVINKVRDQGPVA